MLPARFRVVVLVLLAVVAAGAWASAQLYQRGFAGPARR
jgi:hypothetical protein